MYVLSLPLQEELVLFVCTLFVCLLDCYFVFVFILYVLSLPLQEEVVLFVFSLDLEGKTYSVHLNSFPELPNRAVQWGSTVLYCPVLYSIVVYCTVLYCTVL